VAEAKLDGYEDFRGCVTNAAPAKLPPGAFQTDQGGERFRVGVWRRRRGMLHTSLAQHDEAVTTLLGFELPGGTFALMVGEGANAHGFTDVTEQDWTAAAASGGGFGEAEFGEGEFGE
jgi:hypothetical protein